MTLYLKEVFGLSIEFPNEAGVFKMEVQQLAPQNKIREEMVVEDLVFVGSSGFVISD